MSKATFHQSQVVIFVAAVNSTVRRGVARDPWAGFRNTRDQRRGTSLAIRSSPIRRSTPRSTTCGPAMRRAARTWKPSAVVGTALPAFVTAIYAAFGPGPVAVILVQHALGIVAAVLFTVLLLRLATPRVALVGGLVWSVYPLNDAPSRFCSRPRPS